MRGTVVQQWVTELCTWKEQTVLFCAVRGPDAGGSPEVKSWTRYIRRTVLYNAAPKKTFMRPEDPIDIKELANTKPLVLDMLSVHYLAHLMHALQIIGYKRGDSVAVLAYQELCEYLHLAPEKPIDMKERLSDEIEHGNLNP